MNLQRGAPCWSTQIIRTVRSPCSWSSSCERSAACCCSAVSRPCSVTKPCLPTPRSELIWGSLARGRSGRAVPSCVVAEDETGADGHQALVLGLRDHQREQRVVVGVDAGRDHV